MESTSFMRVDEVAQELGISKSYAYKIVQQRNKIQSGIESSPRACGGVIPAR